ncbi:hypothetical protein ASG11_16800 [Sphingomonas sp. Leaf357]|uniref:hypothetical protein n=1 Tax=Sphingomonas sp. Leaf357 TaxID=1736350 RepID=UPI0007010E26|nr:hypothetical protein [Sphingomonas sp. Leaf357]KQS01344.1 hypothetical protein ASG11_16800 [Sphingomonas sp. Leaf357]
MSAFGGRRTLLELLHIVTGVIATGVFASLAAWAVPHAHDAIWAVAWASAAVIIFMGIRPLRQARRADDSSANGDRNPVD